jgi:hypothetical protein
MDIQLVIEQQQTAMDLTYKFPRDTSQDYIAPRPSKQAQSRSDAMSVRCPFSTYVSFLIVSASFRLNQTASPLLCLPAEIRLQIWEHALGGNRIIPASYLSGHKREHKLFYPSRIYLRAEPLENIRAFLNLLRVCRQIHRESHLLPFSSNVFEYWWSNGWPWKDYSSAWSHVMYCLSEDQKNAIEWVSFQGGGGLTQVQTKMPHASCYCWGEFSQLGGLKVVIRKAPMHPHDWEAIEKFAQDRNCRVVEEEVVLIEGLYTLP